MREALELGLTAWQRCVRRPLPLLERQEGNAVLTGGREGLAVTEAWIGATRTNDGRRQPVERATGAATKREKGTTRRVEHLMIPEDREGRWRDDRRHDRGGARKEQRESVNP
jgi:hypothetical protein